jgi:SAM-dependent methyltransferase
MGVYKILNVGSGQEKEGDILFDIVPPEGEVLKNFVQGDAELGLPFPNKSFSKVIANAVIEHLKNPDDFISECCRVARDKVTIRTDNVEYIGHAIRRQFFKRGAYNHPEHKHRWNFETFSNLVEASCNCQYKIEFDYSRQRCWVRLLTKLLPINEHFKYGFMRVDIFPSSERESKGKSLAPDWNR